jgi:hypothetical protein
MHVWWYNHGLGNLKNVFENVILPFCIFSPTTFTLKKREQMEFGAFCLFMNKNKTKLEIKVVELIYADLNINLVI